MTHDDAVFFFSNHVPPFPPPSAIRPSELVGLAWSKADKEERAPNVLAMIARSNAVTTWVVRTVLECSDFVERAEAMACFDLLLKWTTLRFLETNPKVLLKAMVFIKVWGRGEGGVFCGLAPAHFSFPPRSS